VDLEVFAGAAPAGIQGLHSRRLPRDHHLVRIFRAVLISARELLETQSDRWGIWWFAMINSITSHCCRLVCRVIRSQKQKKEHRKPAALDSVRAASSRMAPNTQTRGTGSLWTPSAWFFRSTAEPRARPSIDIVHHNCGVRRALGREQRCDPKCRKSSAQNSITARAGVTQLPGKKTLCEPANLGGQTTLDGQADQPHHDPDNHCIGARPSHFSERHLVSEGSKNVGIKSENQVITVRVVILPIVWIPPIPVLIPRPLKWKFSSNEQGVVADAVRPPKLPFTVCCSVCCLSRESQRVFHCFFSFDAGAGAATNGTRLK